jgi:hypothetical protein
VGSGTVFAGGEDRFRSGVRGHGGIVVFAVFGAKFDPAGVSGEAEVELTSWELGILGLSVIGGWDSASIWT